MNNDVLDTPVSKLDISALIAFILTFRYECRTLGDVIATLPDLQTAEKIESLGRCGLTHLAEKMRDQGVTEEHWPLMTTIESWSKDSVRSKALADQPP